MQSLCRDTRASSAVEYGVILAMVVLVIVIAIQGVADKTIAMWDNVDSKTSNAISGN
ncbi:Flp family type IVb pilin [Novosphingobium sp. 1949]|uniref:Flp family type IVb pilin n=1 Tax=Novosphingobium organovorum TaxID=2930092 RepID=A0ABT0BDC4_9SPHN|nr:Flp family type IVb pilin [Novosphingobium organovorum]MCJ2183049.1 Flp family type IVb pilin [Novosphingobium organovorum]